MSGSAAEASSTIMAGVAMAANPAATATPSKAPTPCAADAAGLYRAAAVGTTQIRIARPAPA